MTVDELLARYGDEIEEVIKPYRRQQNDAFTRVQVRHALNNYLRSVPKLFGKFKVICDEKNNPLGVRAEKLVVQFERTAGEEE